jgi:mannose/cellobiose epimerase-like protein (N-acyl-D-glucosamine 2-epimerase family)
MATPTTDDGPLRTGARHRAFLEGETARLLDEARAAALPDGTFASLDDDLRADPTQPRELWVAARMTHLFSVGHLLGRPGDTQLADSGLMGLRTAFADSESGGWFPALGDRGPVDTHKQAYEHAFVVLAAASGTIAGRPGAAELLDEALGVVAAHFWEDEAGAMADVWDREWTTLEAYRGANANMHSVEALLAAADATGDDIWVDHAARIVQRLILEQAREHSWRVPEHYDEHWQILPDYNRDQPRHRFRPFGVTPGHGFEWARLLLHLGTRRTNDDYLVAAQGLFDTALRDGWSEQKPGLAYTTDWDGVPVVRERFHWVLCEAIATAAVLADATGDDRYEEWYARWWQLAEERFIDLERGGWVPELDEDGRRSKGTWSGKADWYHAVQATLIPRLPLTSSIAASARAVSR